MKPMPLDTTSFQNLMDRSLREWNEQFPTCDPHPADPSYTLLEAQAFLVDMLHYYMEAIEDRHLQSYERLLGKDVPTCILNDACENEEEMDNPLLFQCTCIEPYTCYPYQGIQAHIAAETVHVESKDEQALHPNRISFLVYEDNYGVESTEHCLYQGEGKPLFHDGSEKVILHILLENPLPLHEVSTMYMQLEEAGRRIYGVPSFKMGNWRFEVYTLHGWQRVSAIDETHGFLHSGFLKLPISKRMRIYTQFDKTGYWLRITGTDLIYDRIPYIKGIRMNVLALYPVCTLAKTWTIQEDRFPRIPHTIPSQAITLLVQQDELWQQIPFEQTHCSQGWFIKPTRKGSCYRIVYHHEEIDQWLNCDCTITGCSSQQIKLPPFQKLRIALKQKDGRLRDYPIDLHHRKASMYGCYLLDTTLCFGDGYDYLIPHADTDGLFFLDLTRTFEQLTQFSVNSLTLKEEGMQGSLMLPYHREKKTEQQPWNLYQKEDIAAYTKQLPFVALQKVRVLDADASSREKQAVGICVYCSAYTASGIVAPQELAYIDDQLRQALPIATSIKVASLRKHCLRIQIRMDCYADTEGIRNELANILTDTIRKKLEQYQIIYKQDLQEKLLHHPYAQHVRQLRLYLDDMEQKQIHPRRDAWYQLKDIQWM